LKVLLVNPQSSLRNDVGNIIVYDRGFGEHLGIRYLASVLEREGHEVTVVDSHFEGLSAEEMYTICRSKPFDLCGISFVEPIMSQAAAVANVIREAHPKTVLLVGGYGATFVGGDLMKRAPGIDAAVVGEAEVTIVKIVQSLEKGEDWRKHRGLRLPLNGGTIPTGPAEMIEALDTIPWPKRGTREQYFGQANILASRGCMAKCSYCSITELYSQKEGKVTEGSRVRTRNPKNVVDEMEYLNRELGIRHFDFLDDNFTETIRYDRSWGRQFHDNIMRRKLNITWGMQCRAVEVREDTFRLFRASGLRIVSLGIETDVDRVNKLFKKGATKAKNREGINILKSLNIQLFIEMIMMEPTSNLDEIRENVRFLEEIDIVRNYRQPPVSTYRKLALYHGTPITKEMKERGIVWHDGNLLQYRFLDQKVAAFTETIEKWLHHAARVIMLHNEHLHYQASAAGQLDTGLRALKLCRSFLAFDLSVYKQTLDFIDANASASSTDQDLFLSQFMPELARFEDEYNSVHQIVRDAPMRPTARMVDIAEPISSMAS
jgi:anaerobic magnesium-protoporphyrin IX monomethyl ester cyclase